MPRVLIAPTVSTTGDAAAVQKLLAAADCCCDISIWPLSKLAQKNASDWDVLVVIVGCDPFAASDEHSIDAWVKAQVKLIAVWCSSPSRSIPKVVQNLARALVRQDVEALAAAVCRDETIWLGSSGEPAPTKPIKRNKC